MKKVELLKLLREGLKILSKCEVMRDDYKYIGMYEEFQNMRGMGLKYREAVRRLATASMFPTRNPGVLTLVSTDKDAIVRELRATLKTSENYIKEAEREVPRQEKRIGQCKELIAQLDTDFKEKQENEKRFAKIEETQKEQGGKLDDIQGMLKQLLNKNNPT